MAGRSVDIQVGADARADLRELQAVVAKTVLMQPEIERALRDCLEPGPKDSFLARRAERLGAALFYLQSRAESLGGWPVTDEAAGLIRYHRRLLEETVSFAFSVTAIFERRSPRYYSDSLGEPAEQLRKLHRLLSDYLAASSEEPESSADWVPRPGTASLGRLPLGHSLRTPLTVIMGTASSLADPAVEWDPPTEKRMISQIISASSRMSATIDNLVHLAGAADGTLRPERDWTDPGQLLNSLVQDVSARYPDRPAPALAAKLPETWAPGGLIWSDHNLLRSALANLLDNAYRHTQAVTPIQVTAVRSDPDVIIRVADDGPGLPARVREEIEAAETGGILPIRVGTGLPATYVLIQALGGQLTLGNSEAGTSWTITIPTD